MIYDDNQELSNISQSLRELMPSLKPKKGWVKTIREALGMTAAQLAHRLTLHPSRITRIEEEELRLSLTLNTLYKIAEALECDLVYALVPKHDIEDILRERAKKLAITRIQRLQNSMSLENQALNNDQLNAILEHHIDELLRGPLKYLWEDNNDNNI